MEQQPHRIHVNQQLGATAIVGDSMGWAGAGWSRLRPLLFHWIVSSLYPCLCPCPCPFQEKTQRKAAEPRRRKVGLVSRSFCPWLFVKLKSLSLQATGRHLLPENLLSTQAGKIWYLLGAQSMFRLASLCLGVLAFFFRFSPSKIRYLIYDPKRLVGPSPLAEISTDHFDASPSLFCSSRRFFSDDIGLAPL